MTVIDMKEETMRIGIVKQSGDARVAMMPAPLKKLCRLEGLDVTIEKGLTNLVSDADYEAAGAKLGDRAKILGESDLLLWVNPPEFSEIEQMKAGAISISFMDPYNNKPLVEKYLASKVSAISMEMIPRTTLAQKMDALSSQASLAGYVAVLLGANQLDRIFPMMMTPAGTIAPVRVFVIGAGVAGLQAIATAKRLGARVEAFDTRAVVEEQVASLGAKFVKVDLGETGQTKDGYAKALTEEQLKKQQEAMAKSCANADLVITTAKLFGRKAPLIVTKEILKQMRDGAVVVDLAAGTGGNVAGTVVDETTVIEGVQVIGIDNLPGEVAYDASDMYASNLVNLITHFYSSETGTVDLSQEDEIMAGCLITHGGAMVNERLKEVYQ